MCDLNNDIETTSTESYEFDEDINTDSTVSITKGFDS
jgi:hypothetical protein